MLSSAQAVQFMAAISKEVNFNYYQETRVCCCFPIYLNTSMYTAPVDKIILKNKCCEIVDPCRMNFSEQKLFVEQSLYRPQLNRMRSDSYTTSDGRTERTTTITQSQSITRAKVGEDADRMRADLETFKDDNRMSCLCFIDYALCSIFDLRKRKVVRRLKERGYNVHVFQSDVITIFNTANCELKDDRGFEHDILLKNDNMLSYNFKNRKFSGLYLDKTTADINVFLKMISDIENLQGKFSEGCAGICCCQFKPKDVPLEVQKYFKGMDCSKINVVFRNGYVQRLTVM